MRAAFFSITVRITAPVFRASSRFPFFSSQFGIFHPWRNDNFLRNFLIYGCDVVAMAVVKDANDGCVGPVERADNSSLSAAVWSDRADLSEHAISVHCRADRRRRNENVSCEASLQPTIQ